MLIELPNKRKSQRGSLCDETDNLVPVQDSLQLTEEQELLQSNMISSESSHFYIYN